MFHHVAEIDKTSKANYKEARIHISSCFNIKLWQKKLEAYHDKHLVNLLTYGFPLGIKDRDNLKRHVISNHSSATQYPEAITEYIEKELSEHALLGPFSQPPHALYHCSPLLTRPKGEHKRRVIVDLSYGDNNSVNGATAKETYEDVPFTLQLPTLDHLLGQITSRKDPYLIKADIARAFRNVPIDPRDAIKCGIAHKGSYFIDKNLVFGAVMGTMFFQRISSAIKFILEQENTVIWSYIDDLFAAVEGREAQDKFEKMCSTVTDLGLPLNPDKVKSPNKVMDIMGIIVNVTNETLSIPAEKLRDITDICNSFHEKHTCTKKELQSLLGKLLCVSKIIKPARGFLNRMLCTLRVMENTTYL